MFLDHCIDSIRQALMCHANTQLFSFEWNDHVRLPAGPELKTDSVTTCVNWDSLDSWARKRALVMGQFKYRAGPFPMNKGSR